MAGLFDTLLSLWAPHICVGCSRDGRLLCTACLSHLRPSRPVCYRCERSSIAGRTCDACHPVTPLRVVQGAVAYDGLAKQLVSAYKFNYARAAADEMADIMMRRFAPLLRDPATLLVPVPTATSRVRQRGYDQAVVLARALSARCFARCALPLIRLGQSQQHGASRRQRLEQTANAFRVVRPDLVRRRRIVLVDDVLTTGATFEAAATALEESGAGPLAAIAFARAELV